MVDPVPVQQSVLREFVVRARYTAQMEAVIFVSASSKREAARLVRANGGVTEYTNTLDATRLRVHSVEAAE